jgi:S-adenosylmethionine decarboxylase proenzyme
MQGLHLTADLFDCSDPDRLMADGQALRALCERLTQAAGLRVVGSHFHAFPGARGASGGLTGVLLLAESHLAIHTWPEQRAVTLDVYVCNFSQDNGPKAQGLVQALVASFGAAQVDSQRLARGRR